MANGRRIGVAISDDAIMVGHEDLEENIWPGSPGMLGAEAHGTEVASVVGAVGNNGIGIAGVNWDVEILSATDASDLSDIIVIFEMALDLRQEFNSTQGTAGLMVVSVTASWTLGTDTPELCDGFSDALFADMADAGIIVVTGGDNAPVDLDNIPSYPSSCALQEHLVVTGYGPLGETPFAFGENSVHLLAPGIDIPAATEGGGYTVVQGNSYAIPHLAGAVALLYSIPCGGFAQLVMDDPQTAATMVRSAILDNTTPVAGADALTITGGKLNIHAAYLALMAQCPQCDTLTVNLATPAGNSAQYALLRGTGSSVIQGVGDAIQFCAEEGCFTATVVDGAQQPLDGTFTVEFDGAVIANGTIVNGEMSFDFGTVTSGCTNFTAQNFDPLANCDDGSCCTENWVTIVLNAVDPVANGTAQLSVESAGNSLYNGPVAIVYDTDANVSYGVVNVCAPDGCSIVSAQEGDVALQAIGFAFTVSGASQLFEFPIGETISLPFGASIIELCDGIDNDCDGEVDEDFIWYLDNDGDGWGLAATAQVFCTPPNGGFSQLAGDCDDADANVNPGMPDPCSTPDGIDNDCSGTADDGEQFFWYPDLDGDGFGDQDGEVIACTMPPGYVGQAGDCDDSDPSIYPGVDELCDGLDNNCDGQVDEGTVWYADLDGDGYGDPNTGILSCSQPPGTVNVDGDCDDTEPAINPGALEACDGVDSNCDGIADAELTGCTDPTACNYDPQAVCPDGSCIDGSTTTGEEVYSPDWTATDTDGNTVDLHAILAEGKTVVLDLFAAWCDPSIAMFTSGFLNDWNDHMGPNGTDDIRIIAIAVDQSAGNLAPFIASSNWPVIVDGGIELGELYAAAGLLQPVVPTVLMICPDRSATVLYGGLNSTLPFTGQFIYDPVAARELLAADCGCRGIPCVTNLGCMDPSACNYDPTATCPTGDCIQATTWYQDADGDTYGNANVSQIACEQPTGYVANNLDCDDTNGAVYPGGQGANSCSTCEEEDQLWVLENRFDYQDLAFSCASTCNGDPDFAGCLSACIAPQVPIAVECTACMVQFVECVLSCNGCYDNCEQLFLICSGTTDLDGDGWFTPLDCDDNNPTTYPFAPELCDGLDNDCNGVVDDGGTMYHTDADGDGFGDPSTGVTTCTPQPGAVLNGDDCDDTDPTVYPGALEVCDGIDNDCDGIVDEGSTWYTDADGDGYGDDATAQVTCTPAPGAVQVGGDCDDTDPELIDEVVVFVFAAEGVTSGTAHYVITQGSNVYESDMALTDDGFGYVYGSAGACLGSGCYSISVSEVDVALQEFAIVRVATDGYEQYQFDISEGYVGNNGGTGVEICDGIDNDCDGIIDEDCDVSLQVRAFLEGPYNASTGLMSDGVRSLGLVPTIEPYTGLGYVHVGGGGESTTPAVLAISGDDAIVDWVLLELRSPLDPSVIIESRSALLQRDGDVVDVDGTSAVSFSVASGEYHVAVRHRNHLGCMSNLPTTLGPVSNPVDLTSNATLVHGIQARRSVAGAFPVEVLWAGDVNFDGNVLYTGQDNDRDPILQVIGGTVPTNSVSGYLGSDVNLDGSVRYTGQENDRDPILQVIGGVVPTNIRVEQLP